MTLRSLPNEVPLFIIFAILATIVYLRTLGGALDITTGASFPAAVIVGAILLLEIVVRIVQPSTETRNNLRVLIGTLAVLAFGVEIISRFGFRSHATFVEESGFDTFVSGFEKPWNRSGWLHVYPAYFELRHHYQEFSHLRVTNRLGLAEQDIPPTKAPGEFRILALGDSFTEGVGTVYDSTWAKAFQRKLSATWPDNRITTFNAGILGSDPFFEYTLLRERLSDLQLDLVIVAINGSDIDDIIMRGGMERFHPDGSTVYRMAAPSWEWLYGISFIFRHYVHDVLRYDWKFMTPDEAAAAQNAAVAQIKSAIDAFARLAEEAGFDLLFVTHPRKQEVIATEYFFGLRDVVTDLTSHPGLASFDLLQYYRSNGIMSEENVAEFYWVIDPHHNGRGYQAMGEAIADAVRRLQLISN